MTSWQAQETRIVFDRFDEDTAWALGVALREAAAEAPVAISIRRNGQRLFHAALAGASADNDGWLDRKCAVVDRYGRSSLRVGEQFRVDGQSFDRDSRLDLSQYAAHGGAFPILVRGVGLRRHRRGIRSPPAGGPSARGRDPRSLPDDAQRG